MDKFWWRLAWGLCLSQLSLAQIDLNITCRYAGVFHVEKNGRYSISKTEAADLCKAFNSTLPTMTEMEAALSIGFETCRYGFIEGHVVIPRIHPNSICAANNTGVYILTSNTSQYDTYCFNASAPPGEDCTSVTHLPNAFEGPITITIVNRDGTRYTQTGEYRTNPEDIYPSNPTDDDVSSGSSSERSTSGGYSIFHTHLPTAYPTQDQDSPGASDNPENPPITITSTVHSNSHAAVQEQTNWMWSWLGNSQPKTQDHTAAATTALMSSSGTTSKTATKRREAQDWLSWWFQPSESENHLHTTTIMAGTDSNIISAGWEPTEENEDERDKHPSYSGSGIDDDEDFISSTNRTDGKGGRRSGHFPEDSATSVEGYTSRSPATKEPRTLIPVTPAKTGVPEVTEVNIAGDSDSNVDRFFSEDQDSPVHPSGRSHTTHGSESAGHTSGSQEGGANTTSGPTRKPQIPEWLIILASLLALALILAVCIAVNSRRRCGQKKKLVINNGNGAVEERKASGLNGEASKSQEMVHLVNKESSVTCDQYMTADETRNLQNVDMKIGV
ncbi:CD44 antigen isoform X8 [Lynx canadensis]|uniref:CD44 antigen isoform X8 n=1 Tax=Lynx canadensis TaxID=61383 RepID=UPI0011B0B942|nr:CD44 antigen isoform X8 [Lynx canadensis]XP_046926551.1 CD44 antigen isoform X4 [Lynx rufus]